MYCINIAVWDIFPMQNRAHTFLSPRRLHTYYSSPCHQPCDLGCGFFQLAHFKSSPNWSQLFLCTFSGLDSLLSYDEAIYCRTPMLWRTQGCCTLSSVLCWHTPGLEWSDPKEILFNSWGPTSMGDRVGFCCCCCLLSHCISLSKCPEIHVVGINVPISHSQYLLHHVHFKWSLTLEISLTCWRVLCRGTGTGKERWRQPCPRTWPWGANQQTQQALLPLHTTHRGAELGRAQVFHKAWLPWEMYDRYQRSTWIEVTREYSGNSIVPHSLQSMRTRNYPLTLEK